MFAWEPAPVGDVWTFCAIDADTKLVPAFRGGRSQYCHR